MSSTASASPPPASGSEGLFVRWPLLAPALQAWAGEVLPASQPG